MPDIELTKCSSQAFKHVIIVEPMTTIYNTILVIDTPNFLEVLPIHLASEFL
jgi:hypothetical protein